MTRQSDIHRRIRIHARRVLSGNGEVASDSLVCCPNGDVMTDMDNCSHCGQCDGLVFDGAPGSSYIICRQVPTPRELADQRRAQGLPDDGPTRVGEVMTRDVVCVKADLGVGSARELLLAKGFGGAPVVDDRGHPIGIVSKTDLLRERFLELDLGEHTATPSGVTPAPADRAVADVMMPVVLSVREGAPVTEAAAVMAEEGVHRVPVVAADGKVVGIVSSLDVLRWIAWENGYLIPTPAAQRPQEW